MKRRTFIKKASITSLACALPPMVPVYSDLEYSIDELIGKADIDLYGKGINLREEAYHAFVAMKKAAHAAGLPTVVAMGGGYSVQLSDIIDAHANTFKVAKEIFE